VVLERDGKPMRIQKQSKNTVLPPDIEAWLAEVPPTEEVLAKIDESRLNLDSDPKFVATFLKGQFVADVYRAMDEMGINKSELADRLGKSKQYVGRILNETANFTIETLAEISCSLGRKVAIRVHRPGESVVVQTRVESPIELHEWDQEHGVAFNRGTGTLNLVGPRTDREVLEDIGSDFISPKKITQSPEKNNVEPLAA